MSNLFESLLQGGVQAYGADKYGDKLNTIGKAAQDGLAAVGKQAVAGTQFSGYNTVSSTGNTATGGNGSTIYNLNDQATASQDAAYASANGLFNEAGVSVADRTDDIFGAAAQALQGQFAMQNTQLGNDLYSSGRTGFNSASFGGSSEQYANRQSQEQSMLNAFYGARTQAGQEQQAQAQAAGSLLGSAQSGTAQLGMTGKIAGQNLATQANVTGTQANINAQIEQAKIQAGMFNSASSVAGQLGSAVDGGIDWLLGKLF